MANDRGRPDRQRQRILQRAQDMRASDGRVNKSRIARELQIPLRTVFRVLPRLSI